MSLFNLQMNLGLILLGFYLFDVCAVLYVSDCMGSDVLLFHYQDGDVRFKRSELVLS